MIPIVVGTREDVAGFALAGVNGVVCKTREEASAAIEQSGAETLVILSTEFAAEASFGPLVVVLQSRL